MAEAFRDNDPSDCQISPANSSLVTECAREEENALYTSTTLMIWLRWLRVIRALLWTGGAAGSIIAASHILQSGDSGSKLLAAGCALAGVLLPAVGRSLGLDSSIKEYGRAAAGFKNLQGEFRRARLIWSHRPFREFEAVARPLFKKMNDGRQLSLTPPEICFRLARRKIKAGHYIHDADEPQQLPG
jgi:hypothetical protein